MAKNHSITNLHPLLAIYYKECSTEYRKNGYNVISGNDGKKAVYNKKVLIKFQLKKNNTTPKGSEEVSIDEQAERYYFNYKDNFIIGARPYGNQAHHLIPQQFYNQFTDDTCKQIAKKIDYNCNIGENIIFLPTDYKGSGFCNLPYHLGGHKTYNNEVKKGAKDIEQKLEKYKKEESCKEDDDLPNDILKKFDKLQETLWRMVVRSGRIQLNEVKLPKAKGRKA